MAACISYWREMKEGSVTVCVYEWRGFGTRMLLSWARGEEGKRIVCGHGKAKRPLALLPPFGREKNGCVRKKATCLCLPLLLCPKLRHFVRFLSLLAHDDACTSTRRPSMLLSLRPPHGGGGIN